MNIAFLIVISLLISNQTLQQREIDNAVRISINAYLGSADNDLSKIPFHFIVREEKSGSSNVVYVSAVRSMSVFWGNIPDRYSKLDDRVIFWYETKPKDKKIRNGEMSFQSFCNQFESFLIRDCSIDGKIDYGIQLKLAETQLPGSLRFRIKDGAVSEMKKICRFPNIQFYLEGYNFDVNGNLMFSEGVYDLCSIDKPFKLTSDNFDPAEYVRNKAAFPDEFFKVGNLAFFLTIDKKGRVVKADIYPSNYLIEQSKMDILEETFLSMPNWNPGRVMGREVCYRVLIGL